MMKKIKEIKLQISGFGLIFYSPSSTLEIKEGEDYFSSHFEDPAEVERQALLGQLVGISLGTSGDFIINVFPGYPLEESLDNYRYKLRAGIEVRDGKICVRDLFDLMNWSASVSADQCIDLENGFYHMTFLSREPDSGVFGEGQVIDLYLNGLSEMPKLRFNGIPTLF